MTTAFKPFNWIKSKIKCSKAAALPTAEQLLLLKKTTENSFLTCLSNKICALTVSTMDQPKLCFYSCFCNSHFKNCLGNYWSLTQLPSLDIDWLIQWPAIACLSLWKLPVEKKWKQFVGLSGNIGTLPPPIACKHCQATVSCWPVLFALAWSI